MVTSEEQEVDLCVKLEESWGQMLAKQAAADTFLQMSQKKPLGDTGCLAFFNNKLVSVQRRGHLCDERLSPCVGHQPLLCGRGRQL